MKRTLFRTLAFINKYALPRISRRDITRLSSWEKAIVAWRYYVTTRAVDPNL